MTAEAYIGCGVWSVASEQDGALVGGLEVRDVRAFREALGDDVVASLARAMFAIDRLRSANALLKSNALEVPDAPENRKIARAQNHFALACMAFGYQHELARALNELEDAKIQTMLSAPSAWDNLAAIRATWFGSDHDPLAKRLRHALAFHPGDLDKMRDALATWPEKEGMVLVRWRDDYGKNAEWRFGLDLIAHSEGIHANALIAFVEQTQDAQFRAEEAFSEMLLDLLKRNDGQQRSAPPRKPKRKDAE